MFKIITILALLMSLSNLMGCANKSPTPGTYTVYASRQDVAKQQQVTKLLAVIRPESFRRFEGYTQPVIRGLRATGEATAIHVAIYTDRKLPGANQVDSSTKSPASILHNLLKEEFETLAVPTDEMFTDGCWPRVNLQILVLDDKQDGVSTVSYEVVADLQLSDGHMRHNDADGRPVLRLPERLLPEPAKFTITWDQGDRDSETGLQKWQDNLRLIARTVAAEIKKRMNA